MNLLPKQHKEDLRKGFKLRFLITALFVVSAAFCLGLIMLLPAYFLTPGRFIEMASENFYLDDDAPLASEILVQPERIDAKLKFLQAHLSQPASTEIFSGIVLALPSGVSLDSIALSRGTGEKGTIVSVSGNAPSRESLVTFSSALRESGLFAEVDVPVSNLAKDRDLPFSIEMSIAN